MNESRTPKVDAEDRSGCPMCARLQRYADTAWNRGHTMGMKANEDTARQATDALRAEKSAHADTNAILTESLLSTESSLTAALARAEKAEAELERVRKDAERLDRLQQLVDENGECWFQLTRAYDDRALYQLCVAHDQDEPLRHDSIRAAIDADAAIEQEKKDA